jgi:mannitol/fructose-specific phosphotransferase system IIA component
LSLSPRAFFTAGGNLSPAVVFSNTLTNQVNREMKISELLDPAAIVADLNGTGKKDVLAELTDALLKADSSLVRDDVLKVLMERERLGSTGIGDGVAIPHGKPAGGRF